MASDAKKSCWVAKMSPTLASRSLLTDSQEALWILVTGNTCPICVSKSLEKLHNSLHKKVLSLRLAGEYWSRSKFAARRGGLELELERCSGRAVAIGGSWSDVPVPATEEAPKSRYSTCQHHHHYQHHRCHHHHHPLDND